MSYIAKHLMDEEEVIYMAPIHWAIYINGVIYLLLGAILYQVFGTIDPSSKANYLVGGIFGVIGFFSLLNAWIFKFSTELGVTSKRVISKTGLISRNSHELNHNKVESLHVDQSILGRILGYGTITVKGTGGGSAPIPNIDDPMKFRNKAMETIG